MAAEQHPMHPIIRAPEEYEHVNSPVRDDTALGPGEDLDRMPDGVPHSVVGMTALFSVMLAMLVAFMMLAGGTVSRIAAIAITLLAIPVLVSTMRRKAEAERDTRHPSR